MFDRLAQKQPVSPRGTMCLFSSTELGKKYIDFAFSSNLPTNHEHVSKISPCKGSVDSRLSLGQQEAEYKYILDLSGNGWSSRFPYLLGLDMVVLKEEDDPFNDFCHDMSTQALTTSHSRTRQTWSRPWKRCDQAMSIASPLLIAVIVLCINIVRKTLRCVTGKYYWTSTTSYKRLELIIRIRMRLQ